MNKTKKAEIIKKCIDKKCQVSIERKKIDDDALNAIPIVISNKLIVVQYLYDFNFDGFKVLCMSDVSNIKRGRVEKFHDKILESEGLKVKGELISDIKINTWYAFFKFMLDKKKMLDISLERLNNGKTFFIGKIVSAKKDCVEILEIDALGNWYKETSKIFYNDITLVSFSNKYCELLDKYCPNVCSH